MLQMRQREFCSALFRVVPVAGTGKTVGTPTFSGFFVCLFHCSIYIYKLPKPENKVYNVYFEDMSVGRVARQVLIFAEHGT